MRRLVVLVPSASALAVLCSACASEPRSTPQTSTATGGRDPGEPRVVLAAEELRAKWEPLGRAEGDLANGVSSLGSLGPEERVRKLASLRADAGMLSAGIARLEPPPELAACRKAAIEGANRIKQSLDAINEIWMGRAARDRAAADRISMDLCAGFVSLRSGREACGVNAPVALPMGCRQ
jgi:hypothetical protein